MNNKRSFWVLFLAVFLFAGYCLTPNSPSRIALSQLASEDSFAIFEEADRPTVYVFASLDCEFCRRMHGELERINGVNVRVFPLPGHTKASKRLAKGAWCASNRPLAWSRAYSQELSENGSCDDSALDRNLATAKSLGISSTPTTIFPDGTVVTGYLDSQGIQRQLRK